MRALPPMDIPLPKMAVGSGDALGEGQFLLRGPGNPAAVAHAASCPNGVGAMVSNADQLVFWGPVFAIVLKVRGSRRGIGSSVQMC